jgi:hypothetical protein
MNSKIDKVNEVLESIKSSLKEVPSRRELIEHASAMDEQIVQMREVNTGLTTPMEGYKFSESSQFNFRTPQARPSTTIHPERQRYFGSDASTLRDTESEVTGLGRIRGGAGSNGSAGGAAGGAADGAAGGVAGGAAGGAAGVAGDPPPPGSGPPSDHGNINGNR